MPWCPKCGTEYVEGVDKCSDCGVVLAAKPDSEPERAEDGEATLAVSAGDEVFLCNVSGPVEISYITSVLEEEGIPFLMADSKTGLAMEALMGSSFLGKDIYVGKEDVKRASEIVESFKSEMLSENESEEEPEDE